jgi:Fur family ferric uptake transcriptional regulator
MVWCFRLTLIGGIALHRRPANYSTKQSGAILRFLVSHMDSPITAAQIFEHFGQEPVPIGRTTVYRQLEKLVQNGKVRKYTFDGISGACYQFVARNESGREHYHLKCEHCGHIVNLKCSEMDEALGHIWESHEFQINDTKTVFYGKCKACMQNR